ncbi:MAG TPA: hypothetical protein VNJ52_05150 [Patescibacteria group bacterium]|nr:hypothetical protein [Patescibacteria group bacterium]
MKLYRVTILADKYPTDYTVSASGWGTAVSRAIREWKKKFKGSRTVEMTIKVYKSSDVLTAEKAE